MNIPECVNKVACLSFLLSLLWLIPWAASHDILQECRETKEMSLEVVLMRQSTEKNTTEASGEELPSQSSSKVVDNEAPSHLDAGGGKQHSNIVVSVVGIYGKAEPHLSVGFHTHADSKKTDVLKHNEATGKREIHSVENVAEIDLPQVQTHPTEDMRPEAEASGEWDWQVCPSVFGCPCPMMP